MTVCIAAICEGGKELVVAADGMITNPGLSMEFEHKESKIIPLAGSCIALTAGDALAHTELCRSVRQQIEQLKEPSVADVVQQTNSAYHTMREGRIIAEILSPRGFPDFKTFYDSQRVLMPDFAMLVQNQIDRYNVGLEVIIAGLSDKSAHIYYVFNPGSSRCFDAIGFHAIGSGSPHALHTLILRECNQSTPLSDALMNVYEAKLMAEKAPGVGSNITDISVLAPGKTINFPRDRVRELREIHKKWIKSDDSWHGEVCKILKELGVEQQ